MKRFVLFISFVLSSTLACSEPPSAPSLDQVKVEVVGTLPPSASALELEFWAEITDIGPVPSGWEHHWEFGDGIHTNEVRPKHAFPSPGVYEVTVIVHDGTAEGTASLQVEPLGIDLIVADLSLSPTDVLPGDSVIASATVANVGVVESQNAVLSLYLGASDELDPAAEPTASIGVPPIGPGMTYDGAAALTIPDDLEAGAYVVHARVDRTDSVAEFDETNNVKAGGIAVAEPPAPPTPVPSTSPTSSPSPTATP